MQVIQITFPGTFIKRAQFCDDKKVSMDVAKFYLNACEGVYWKASAAFNEDEEKGLLNGLPRTL